MLITILLMLVGLPPLLVMAAGADFTHGPDWGHGWRWYVQWWKARPPRL